MKRPRRLAAEFHLLHYKLTKLSVGLTETPGFCSMLHSVRG